MSRSSWKGPILNKRATSITPELQDKTILVHNGHKYIPVLITSGRVGHKLGEFCMSKKPAKFIK
jgi:ribosomal protein S19